MSTLQNWKKKYDKSSIFHNCKIAWLTGWSIKEENLYIAYIGTFIKNILHHKKLIDTCMVSPFILTSHKLIFNLQTIKLIWAIDMKFTGIHIHSRNKQLRYQKWKHLLLGIFGV